MTEPETADEKATAATIKDTHEKVGEIHDATVRPKPKAKATPKPKAKATPKPKAKAPDKGKAVAKQNAEELEAEATIEEKRERRAEILEELADRDAERTAKVQAEAKEAGLHEAKLDDAGAAEQQKAARDSDVALQTELGELTGAPVTAPVIEESGASIKVASRRDGEEFDRGVDYRVGDSFRFVGFNLHIIGEGFLPKGEVIIDIRRENGQDHQRFSTMTEDGRIDVVLPGVNGIGDWLLHCEQVVTQVGEGRDDHQQLVKETNEVAFELF